MQYWILSVVFLLMFVYVKGILKTLYSVQFQYT